MKARGKRLALIAGSCAVPLLTGVAIVYREDIATAWYLHRMQRDPTLVVEYFDRDESPAMANAVTRFAGTEEGQRALLDSFLSTVLALKREHADRMRIESANRFMVLWVADDRALHVRGYQVSHPPPGYTGQWQGGLRGGGSRTGAGEHYDRLKKIQDLLGDVRAGHIASTRLRGVALSFVPPGSEITYPRGGEYRHVVTDGEGETRYVCVGVKAD